MIAIAKRKKVVAVHGKIGDGKRTLLLAFKIERMQKIVRGGVVKAKNRPREGENIAVKVQKVTRGAFVIAGISRSAKGFYVTKTCDELFFIV